MGFQFNVSLLITAGSFAGIYRYKPEQAVSFLLGQKHDDKPLDNSPKAEKRNKKQINGVGKLSKILKHT